MFDAFTPNGTNYKQTCRFDNMKMLERPSVWANDTLILPRYGVYPLIKPIVL